MATGKDDSAHKLRGAIRLACRVLGTARIKAGRRGRTGGLGSIDLKKCADGR